MGHNHEEYDIPDELIPKLKDYWREPDTLSFNSVIKEVNDEWIRLKNNYFYPEGGGQLPDLGYLFLKSRQSHKYKIVDVQTKEKETWLKIPKHDLAEGGKVSAIIDKNRRISLTRNHSSQHLVSAIFWEELGFNTTRAEIQIYESQVEFNTSPSLEQIDLVNSMITRLINDNLSIDYRYYKNLDQIDLEIRGDMEDLDIYRLVAIGKYDLNPCGGTHVKNTREIESIFINKIESKKVRFLSGNDARSLYSQNAANLIRLSRLTSVPFEELPETVESILNKNIKHEKRIHKLESQIIEIQNQLIKFESLGNYEFKTYQVPNLTKGVSNSINDALKPNEIVFIIDDQSSFTLSTGNEELTRKLMEKFRHLGIKGGGRGKSAMGKFGDIEFKQIKKILNEFLTD